jgi:hypothetical protein
VRPYRVRSQGVLLITIPIVFITLVVLADHHRKAPTEQLRSDPRVQMIVQSAAKMIVQPVTQMIVQPVAQMIIDRRNANGLQINYRTCYGVVHSDGEADFVVVGDCQFWPNTDLGQAILKTCRIGDFCTFRGEVVGLAGPFVERVLMGPVRAGG